MIPTFAIAQLVIISSILFRPIIKHEFYIIKLFFHFTKFQLWKCRSQKTNGNQIIERAQKSDRKKAPTRLFVMSGNPS